MHYHWHWFHNFGTGDIGNDGVHGIDVARWGLGTETHPSFISGYGSKLYFDDDQEFPDTYVITYEYAGDGKAGRKRLLIYEQRIWSPYRQDAEGSSIFFCGTEGMMTPGGGRVRIYGPNNKLRQELDYSLTPGVHQRDFLRRHQRPEPPGECRHPDRSLVFLPEPPGQRGGPRGPFHPARPADGTGRRR
ncbi:MAG TPA: hypothetical protein EYP56_03330 [Planctomycetaceae bacterium]|nr:hypothetical protein [Planctomycetaceae bacterium]